MCYERVCWCDGRAMSGCVRMRGVSWYLISQRLTGVNDVFSVATHHDKMAIAIM